MVLAELGRSLTAALKKASGHVDDTTLAEMLKEICNALLTADVSVKMVAKLKNNIRARINLPDIASGINKAVVIKKVVFEELCQLVDPKVPPFKPEKGKTNVLMLVGLQGSGKTTTVTKLARYYQKRGFKPGVVCADTFRAGAFPQLRMNATKGNIRFYGSDTDTDPVSVASKGVAAFKENNSDLIIVDTSGRHKQEKELFIEMSEITEAVKPDCIIFVMDASIGQAAYDQAMAFKESVPVGAVIITKLDGHAKGGGALSAVAATQSPIIFLGVGERIDDLQAFSPSSFVQGLLGFGNPQEIADIITTITKEQKQQLKNTVSSGKISLRDYQQHLQMTLQMGPDKMLAALPGFSNMAFPSGANPSTQIKSMSEQELDNKVSMTPTRIQRISKGAGKSQEEVQLLLAQYKIFEKCIKATKGKNFSQLASQLPPAFVKSLGGSGRMHNMVRSLMSGEQDSFLPNMSFS